MKTTKTVNSCDCDSVNQELVDKVKKKFPEDEILGDLSDFFKVIGDGTRIRILWALDVSEMCVCDIANILNMTKSAVSHQLRALRDADLVKFRKSGKEVLYSLSDNHVKEMPGRRWQYYRGGHRHCLRRPGCRVLDVDRRHFRRRHILHGMHPRPDI